MYQRSAVQKFDGGGGGRGGNEVGIAAGPGDREAEAWADAGAAGKDGVVEGLGKARRALGSGGPGHGLFELLLQALCNVHVSVSLYPA